MPKLNTAFRKWFGNSAVRNEDGSPKVVYHGTTEKFSSFGITSEEYDHMGYHFGTREQAQHRLREKRAETGTKSGRILSVYLSIQNPLKSTDAGDWSNSYQAWITLNRALGGAMGEYDFSLNTIPRQERLDRIVGIVRSLGYDGVIYRNRIEGTGDSWIAFLPEQIKSVDNDGTWDADDPHIGSNPPVHDPHNLPIAGPVVDGRVVGSSAPNMSSIRASIGNPTVLPGIREVQLSDFGDGSGTPHFYSVEEEKRTLALAEKIRASGRIDPLIVVYDKGGPYILEGGHRFDALILLGAKSFPAKVVIDDDPNIRSNPPVRHIPVSTFPYDFQVLLGDLLDESLESIPVKTVSASGYLKQAKSWRYGSGDERRKPSYLAGLKAYIKRGGAMPPIIVRGDELVDGRHRLLATHPKKIDVIDLNDLAPKISRAYHPPPEIRRANEIVDVTVDDLEEEMRKHPGERAVVVKGQRISGLKPIGDKFWFEYHCLESHDSSDAQLWYRSHQRVTVVDLKDSEIPAYESAYWRSYQGMPLAYTVRFDDGSTFAATEDELLDSPKDFCRPDPPRQMKKGKNPPPARFWGKAGAGILFHCTGDDTYLLVLRSAEVQQSGTLGIPGGACGAEGFFTGKQGKQIGEAQAWVCAMREAKEELGWWPKQKQVASAIVYECENFQYQTFIVDIPASEKAEAARSIQLNWENDEFIWMSLAEMAEAREQLHFGLQYVLDQIGG